MNRINRTRVIGQWPALAHVCAMEEEEGKRGPKTISAEAAFWALRNGTAKPEPEPEPEPKPVAEAPPATPRIRRVVTEPDAPLKTAPAPRPLPTPMQKQTSGQRPTHDQKNARLRAALLPNARLAVPKDIDYTGMEDWADETAVHEEYYSD